MNTLKKLTLAVVLILTLAFSLMILGCGEQEKPAKEETSVQTETAAEPVAPVADTTADTTATPPPPPPQK